MTLDVYWDKDENELFELLGASLLGEGLGISPEDQESHRRFGRDWFDNKRRQLQRMICHDPRVQGLLGTTTSDRMIDAAAVYELLKDLGEDPVTAAVLAVLVARISLGAFCASAPPLP